MLGRTTLTNLCRRKKFLNVDDRFLANRFGEDQLCGQLNYPETDILAILRNVIDATHREPSVNVDDGCTELCRQVGRCY